MASASFSLSSRLRALIRSSFVLKYVNRVPSATPACFDISDVGAAVRPRSANSRVAASRIAFRLSSLLGRATELPYYRVHTQLYIGSMLTARQGRPKSRQRVGNRLNGNKPPSHSLTGSWSNRLLTSTIAKTVADEGSLSSSYRQLLQFRVFRLGFFQDGDVGVGVFPKGEEVLIGGAGLGGVAGKSVGAGEA